MWVKWSRDENFADRYLYNKINNLVFFINFYGQTMLQFMKKVANNVIF
nr:MAG TPA: hypothetical protein [Caudoviricetes sp.]